MIFSVLVLRNVGIVEWINKNKEESMIHVDLDIVKKCDACKEIIDDEGYVLSIGSKKINLCLDCKEDLVEQLNEENIGTVDYDDEDSEDSEDCAADN